nr:hypothetical protein [Candidatus Paceibacterota bacterium]
MPWSNYLPSAQFTLVVTSIALAGGLVLAADYLTSPQEGGGAIVATDTPTDMETMDWKGSLTAILGENTAAKPIDAATLASLQAETKTDTLT